MPNAGFAGYGAPHCGQEMSYPGGELVATAKAVRSPAWSVPSTASAAAAPGNDASRRPTAANAGRTARRSLRLKAGSPLRRPARIGRDPDPPLRRRAGARGSLPARHGSRLRQIAYGRGWRRSYLPFAESFGLFCFGFLGVLAFLSTRRASFDDGPLIVRPDTPERTSVLRPRTARRT